MSTTITIESLTELEQFAKDFFVSHLPASSDRTTVLALSGDLGAGKTTLVQRLAKELGVTEMVTVQPLRL